MHTINNIILTAAGNRKADLVLKNTVYLNVFTNEFLEGDIAICDGRFAGIGQYNGEKELDMKGLTIVPGFLDGHIHLESTCVRPETFARTAMQHGTVALVTDPHEITNVMGTDGIDFMLESTKDLPMDIFFMIPSCVPSCPFDECGAVLTAEDVKKYLTNDRILGLAEMMNAPGVTSCDQDTIAKITATTESGKLTDGHAPGLSDKQLMAYVASGIYSDHECSTVEEAMEKLRAGQWIMIREGTAGKNLNSLLPLCQAPYDARCMFSTDDRHIDDVLKEGHIDYIIRSAIAAGVNPATAYRMASFNTASYFGLKQRGAIAPGYLADFVVLSDIEHVTIHAVYKNGIAMTDDYLDTHCNITLSDNLLSKALHTVHLEEITPETLCIGQTPRKVIGLVPGELITTDEGEADGIDVSRDILKLCVIERHKYTGHIGISYLKGYGLKDGAIATSVAHDSHNIIAVGTNDEDIACAVNTLRQMDGGMAVVCRKKVIASFALPVAGLMSNLNANEASDSLKAIHDAAYDLGVNPSIDPFMTLSFTSLPVIPKLKLTTLGVVDVEKFQIIS